MLSLDKKSSFLTSVQLKQAVASLVGRQRRIVHNAELTSAAVLIPIVERDGEPSFILTKRTMTVAKHKGQISFPGGVAQEDDAGPVETALREAEEEIGLSPQHVRVAGLYHDMETSTGFVVSPVIGFVLPSVRLQPQPSEVDEIFEAPIRMFFNERLREDRVLEHGGVTYNDVRYDIYGHEVWGATSRIITRFLEDILELGSEFSADSRGGVDESA